MNTKTFAIVVAVFMVVSGALVAVSDDIDKSDAASGNAGYMNVYVNAGNGWSGQTVQAANGCEALKASNFYSASTATIDDSYTISYVYNNNTYTDINAAYGTVTKLQGESNSGNDVWNVLVYINDGNGNWSWNVGISASGYYKPFDDYAAKLVAYGNANIAFWYGNIEDDDEYDAAISGLGSVTLPVRGLTAVSKVPGSVYEHIFYLKNDTNAQMTVSDTVKLYDPSDGSVTLNTTISDSDLATGLYVAGYGSDAELALIDAIGDNANFYSFASPVPGYETYGWIDDLFGVNTVPVVIGEGEEAVTHYYFWSTYTEYDLVNSYEVWAGYNIGAYSALLNAPLVDGTFAIIYEYS